MAKRHGFLFGRNPNRSKGLRSAPGPPCAIRHDTAAGRSAAEGTVRAAAMADTKPPRSPGFAAAKWRNFGRPKADRVGPMRRCARGDRARHGRPRGRRAAGERGRCFAPGPDIGRDGPALEPAAGHRRGDHRRGVAGRPGLHRHDRPGRAVPARAPGPVAPARRPAPGPGRRRRRGPLPRRLRDGRHLAPHRRAVVGRGQHRAVPLDRRPGPPADQPGGGAIPGQRLADLPHAGEPLPPLGGRVPRHDRQVRRRRVDRRAHGDGPARRRFVRPRG